MFQLKGKKVFVAGHTGMVGQAIVRRLASEECSIVSASKEELDLRVSTQVDEWFANHKPDVVALAAARVGGILSNMQNQVDFLLDNLKIEINVIENSYKYNVEKLVFLGSSCIYPKNSPQPMKEEYLLSSELESTNKAYALAKICGIHLCSSYYEQFGKNFISLMPTNLYGPGDTYSLKNSHVIPALIHKIHSAKINNENQVHVWGRGHVRREFLFVDDLADATIFLLKHYSGKEHVNVGFGTDVTIEELVYQISETLEYRGTFKFDASMPEGVAKKLLDVSKLQQLGWTARTSLAEGLKIAYASYLSGNCKLFNE